MAINQNHLFEELNGLKCSIVEKNASPQRTDFLRRILEYNRFTVVVVPSPPPKVAAVSLAATPPPPKAPAASTTDPSAPLPTAPAPTAETPPTPTPEPVAEIPPPVAPAPPPETFTVGVTDVLFNSVNAIFGRLLKAPGGHTVTLAYWQQKETESNDETPYYEAR